MDNEYVLRLSFPSSSTISIDSIKRKLIKYNHLLPLSYERRASFCTYIPLYELDNASSFTFDYLTFSTSQDALRAYQILKLHKKSCKDLTWKNLVLAILPQKPQLRFHCLSTVDVWERRNALQPVSVLPAIPLSVALRSVRSS